jgi:preprotein translocase subunit SecY
MISAFTNTFKIPELRNRVLFTLVLLVVVRIGAAITCPGVNAHVLQTWFASQVNNEAGGSVAALFNIFSGGALENCALFSLGVMPYISASIMLQLLTAVIRSSASCPRRMAAAEDHAVHALCDHRAVLFQGYLLALTFENPASSPFLHGIMDTINKMGIRSWRSRAGRSAS